MIPTAPFGRSGHQSTRIIFGAAALGRMSQSRADEVLAVVERFGINHIDTAAAYGDSEVRLAPYLVTRRRDVFLATKTGERTGDAARASLERSLDRLAVESVDLIQLHNLVEEDEWDTAHGRRGAVEALAKSRDEGLVRFIGVTGHGLRIPRMHLRSLERFEFDSVLFPYNYSLMGLHGYRADVEELLGACEARGVATQTIKSAARRRWQGDDGPRSSWYEPITEPDALTRSVRYVLSGPGLFVLSTSDARLLPVVFRAAEGDAPAPSEAELAADVRTLGVEPLFDGGARDRI
jgi:aryl-alcohol dehydrogenase-like predicted oxidoreductase